ncbi:MAG: cyclic nucleotide-binding domain-containing protein, partial [Anaerolineae bacterium]|nr:cyclic nucleotide-binding domain-containing protein [Anaerolineae bacterium]
LHESELEQIAHLAQEEHFNAHDTIFSQNTPGEKMYIVGRGQVEIRVLDEHGESHTTLFLGQGQVFGEMALLDQGTRSATVLAAQANTTVYGIDGQKLLQLCQQDTRIGYVMMRNIALDLSFKIRHHNYGL